VTVPHELLPAVFEASPERLAAKHPFAKFAHELSPAVLEASPVRLNAPHEKRLRLPHDPVPAVLDAFPVPFSSKSPPVIAMHRGISPSSPPLHDPVPAVFDALPVPLTA
jgi:hypothetical protein